MERQQCNALQNFDESKTDILKKRLLKSTNISVAANLAQNSSQHNVLLNTLRATTSNSMIVSSMQAPQSSMPITHSIGPVKIHTSSAPYPLHLSTVHVPVHIPGSTSNINVPVQLTGPTSSVPLQIAPVTLPIQVSTASVPVHFSPSDTINVPLQIPTASQNIQLTAPALPSMPILQTTSQPLHSSIIHLHMGSNPRPPNMDVGSDMTVSSSSHLQLPDSTGIQVKMANPTTISQVQVSSNTTVMQIPSSSNNSIQLTLPSTGSSGTVQLRGTARTVPHMVYIQTATGLKPVTSTEVISQASTSGNPPQIIVRRPVTSNSNLQLIQNVGNKPNIAPKVPGQKSSLLTSANTSQPIVIQKPKPNEKMMVPVSIAQGTQGKQAIAYLKKPAAKTVPENQSILISNNHSNVNSNNQKLFLTPMTVNKMHNTKFILPVTLPAMSSKGPIINLQIANGQIQNDPQGNITVMRDTGSIETSEMPPLQPLAKVVNSNGKDGNPVPQSPKSEKAFAISISGSRAEPTGEQEYTLSIPETTAAMNDDVYTVSIADEDGGQREKSFTLAIPEKGKSLLNRNVIERSDLTPVTIAAPAILRRSNSDNSERKSGNANTKRRISLCNENLSNKNFKLNPPLLKPMEKSEDQPDTDNNDDHRVPSLFCDEKLDKDLEAKASLGDSDPEDIKGRKPEQKLEKNHHELYYHKIDKFVKKESSARIKRGSFESCLEEDPPGLIWNNGVAQLQGSTLQFQTNEFGLIDTIDTSDQEEVLIPSAKYHTPLKQRIDRGGREKKPTSPEDLYCCDGCGCHGMAAEFITPNVCSLTCQTEVQKVAQKKKDREKNELAKKRNKMKKLLIRKQLSDSDILQDKEEKLTLKHYDSTPVDAHISDASLKLSEDLVENEKYPWMCGKNGFSWMRYLDICKAKAAPVKLFKDPFPYTRNNFKVGMRMEAIDPQHPSLFCVVSVAEVQGFRMRLHFDECADVFDYWVNADSADVFPAGWCEKSGRALRPPPSYTPNTFSWPLYLKQMRAIAAPKHLFPHLTTTTIKPNGFRTGMKLEAEDRKNELVCVASVADMLDNRLLVNFDSWDEMYDFWVEPSSPYIHPVGWAEENGVSLTPPNFYKDPDSFSWENYLVETGASPAPPRAFKTRAPAGFKPGMKLEVVDPRVPFLIRVATISVVRGHQVCVSFDGWGEALTCWLDDDSPDLHPVGWCLKTQHPLEPPLTVEELRVPGGCGVGGCRGLGSLRGGAHKQHSAASACPYRPRAPPPTPDRLAAPGTPDHALPTPRRVAAKQPKCATTPTSDAPKEKLPRGRPPKHKRVEEVAKEVSDDESVSSGAGAGSRASGGKRWRREEKETRPLRTYSRASHAAPPVSPPSALTAAPAAASSPPTPPPPPPPRAAPPAPALTHCSKHVADLALSTDPTVWSQHEVAALVSRVAGGAAGAAAAAARLSGAELLMASCDELVHCMRLRLGPAIKLHAAVRQLRDKLT